MKSSFLSMLPWTHTHSQRSGYRPEIVNQNSAGLTRSDVDTDMKDKTVCLGLGKANLSPHSQSRQRKMPPLLRLDSEGEISSGKNFCDRAASNQFDKINNKLHLSNSFDSSYSYMAATPNSMTSGNKPLQSPSKNIPHPPSFKKSVSEPIGLPIHQSFPPPSSPSSAINRSNFSCPVTERFCPYSSNPRVLGIVNIFGMNSQVNGDGMQSKSNCTSTSSPCAKKFFMKGQMDVIDDSVCKNVNKMSPSKSNVADGDESPFCINRDNSHNQSAASDSSSMGCEHELSQNSAQATPSGNESSSILFIRKKKRKRSRNRRKRGKNQGLDCDNESTPFRPSSCSSPLKNASTSTPSAEEMTAQGPSISKACPSSVLNVKIVSPICQIMSKSKSKQKKKQQSSPVDITPSSPSTFCSDLQHSVNEDGLSDDDGLVFEDTSVLFFENSPPSTCSSKVSLRKRKSKKVVNNSSSVASDGSDDDDDHSSSTSGLHFTVSVTVSEDEENDSSVDWDSVASPSDNSQFLFEFEFNTGLSLDNIMGQPPSYECPEVRAAQKKLRDINKKWNQVYTASSFTGNGILLNNANQRKVQFAEEDQLTTVHYVSDEDRAGEWHHFALERARFKRRIEDVEKVLAPVLCESHRAKVFSRVC